MNGVFFAMYQSPEAGGIGWTFSEMMDTDLDVFKAMVDKLGKQHEAVEAAAAKMKARGRGRR